LILQNIGRLVQTAAARYAISSRQALLGILALATAVSLPACDSNKKTSKEVDAQRPLPLAKVNDVEISLLQPAIELAPAAAQSAATKAAVNKQLLEIMIDRQLLQKEALRNNLDRDPQVIQATENAKTQILAEAYLQSRFATIGAPGKAEVRAYYQAHPELFTQRKTFYMEELVVATKDFSGQLKTRLDSAQSIEPVAAWLDQNHVRYERNQVARSTADLAPEMITKLQTMRKNQLFVVKAGQYSMVNALYDVKLSPMTAEAAAPQIELYLRNKKRKEIGDVELGKLRASARIEYLDNRKLASAPVPATRSGGSPAPIKIENGTTGFK
jgi:peptidyl-prolyl cis-trans isomerase C